MIAYSISTAAVHTRPTTAQPAIITTNFRPFEAVILHMVTRAKRDVPVVWMDNGYNTDATYRFADEVTKQLNLNLQGQNRPDQPQNQQSRRR